MDMIYRQTGFILQLTFGRINIVIVI